VGSKNVIVILAASLHSYRTTGACSRVNQGVPFDKSDVTGQAESNGFGCSLKVFEGSSSQLTQRSFALHRPSMKEASQVK